LVPAKASPTVSDCVCPDAVCSVKLSHAGANEAGQDQHHGGTGRGPARPAQRVGGARPASRPDQEGEGRAGGAGEPAEEGQDEAGTAGCPGAADGQARVREEQAERDGAQAQAQQRADPRAGAAEEDEHRAHGPDAQVDSVREELVGAVGEAGTAQVRGEEPSHSQGDADAE
jgi:hypothetical protein